MPGYNSPSRGTPALFQTVCILKFCVVLEFCVVLCIVCFVSFCILLVCKCVLYNCHRVATHLQLTNIYHNLGRGMPESVVREELESLNIRVQGVMQLRSSRRDQDPVKDRPPTPTSLSRWRKGLRCRKCDYSPNSTACEWLQKAHCNASGASASAKRSVTAYRCPGVSRVGLVPLRWMFCPAGTASMLCLRGKPHGELPGLC
jgi:hypothetical protein